ncbi:hypothetical protein NDU88_002180 [Pleurodeles waltl]|uniref:Uncharacterized protein n=1 Tax=Pleurodeles waltl TaxID=8319 RepID=A0AAV7LFC8_PLEWA|nr:hypothetical protein NDU88_002180 [Pleurodeles waltl]
MSQAMRRAALPATQSAAHHSNTSRAAHRPSNPATPPKLPKILMRGMRDRGVGAAVAPMTKRAGLEG